MKSIATIYSKSSAGFWEFDGYLKFLFSKNVGILMNLGFLPSLGPLIAESDNNAGENGLYSYSLGS